MSIIELLGVIVALIAVAVSIVLQWVQNRDMFFAEYARRYQEIWLNSPGSTPEDADDKNIFLYLDLCSEEWHLYKTHRLPQKVWNNWKEGMSRIMKFDRYRSYWALHKGDYEKDFQIFMDELQVIEPTKVL